MQPVKTYSPTAFAVAVGLGSVIFVALMLVAWTTGSDEVSLDITFRLELTAAAFVLGGGLIGWGLRYRSQAREEAELKAMVRRNLGG